ncbi:MAG TPA: pyridoxal-dependent decarboxylase [Pirellulales bacterium]|jgi:glutamate/tyrosine decarboxylase-like PLP-dependent enzyme|nr:pyridoxal-dependent decarboxylase [Pirellulales bacterium]
MTTPRYRERLESLRQAFPQPVSNPVHDAYFVFSILRALEQVDALKSQAPILGTPCQPDYEAARRRRVEPDGKSLEAVIPELVQYLHGMFVWGHPGSQLNIVPQPSIASIIGVLLPSIYNPNLCSDESAIRIAEAEVSAAAMTAELIGYDPAAAAGVFTFGGTGGLLYGVRIGLEKAIPGAGQRGLRDDAVVLVSQQGHYSCLNVAAWLGIGQDHVVAAPSHLDNSVRLDDLEDAASAAIAKGQRIAAIIATMGTTDAFGIDDLEAIHALRERLIAEFKLDYRPHIHADAVIGWAWSAFNDYDWLANDLGFRGRTIRALAAASHRIRHLHLADTVGIDFHKTGFAPYVSSLVLAKDRDVFGRIARSRATMPYLFQSGEYHPAMFTLETTRAGTGPLAALASLRLLGKEGLRVLLGHAVEMAEVLREHIESHPNLTVLNGDNVGPVTLFRAYPDGIDTFSVKQREQSDRSYRDSLMDHNDYNRRIYELVHSEALAGRGVAISLTDCYRQTDYGESIVALKSYVVSPFSDESRMESIIRHVLQARAQIDGLTKR